MLNKILKLMLLTLVAGSMQALACEFPNQWCAVGDYCCYGVTLCTLPGYCPAGASDKAKFGLIEQVIHRRDATPELQCSVSTPITSNAVIAR